MKKNNDRINVRLAEKEDKEAILDVCKNIWEGNDYIFLVIDKWLENKGAYFFVLEYEGKITHLARLRLQPKNTGWFEGLRGDPNYQGKGLAKIISQHIIDYSKKLGLDKVRAATYFKNDASVNLLSKKVGFEIPYKYLVGWKNPEILTYKEIDKEVMPLNKKDLDKVIMFLNSSNRYDEYNRLIGNGWYFEEHTEEEWLNMLKAEEVYTIKSDELTSLITIRRGHTRPRYCIGFVDGSIEDINTLVDYAENKAKKEEKRLLFEVPEKSSLVDLHRNKKFEIPEPTDANMYIFEIKLK